MCDSYTGDVREHARTSVFAWEAAERGQEVHPIADPSQAEMLRKKFDDKKTTLKEVCWVCCCFGSGRGIWLVWVGGCAGRCLWRLVGGGAGREFS